LLKIFYSKNMIKNTSYCVTYSAWNSSDGSLCSGDAANHTCRISQDGGEFVTASNSPEELGGGVYSLTLTASETNASTLTLSVSSSSSGVIVPPVQFIFHDPSSFKADVSSIASDVWKVSSRSLTGSVEVSSSSISSIQNGLATSSALTSLSSNVSALPSNIWGASFRSLTDSVNISAASVSAIQNGLASSEDLASVAEKVELLSNVCDTISVSCEAIQIRTNLIPDRPAAIGSAMTLNDSYANLLTLSPDSIAASVLAFDISIVEKSAPVYSLCTVILAHLQSAVDGSSWTIYRTDGLTQHALRNVTASEESIPITGVSDPS